MPPSPDHRLGNAVEEARQAARRRERSRGKRRGEEVKEAADCRFVQAQEAQTRGQSGEGMSNITMSKILTVSTPRIC